MAAMRTPRSRLPLVGRHGENILKSVPDRIDDSFRARGGWWVIGQGILILAELALGVAFRGQWQAAVNVMVGGIFLALGAWLGIAGLHALGKNLTPFPKPRPGSAFVRTGAYGIVRHPLYTSVFLLAISWSLLWRSGPALWGAIVLVIYFDAKARREERWLHEKFPEYSAYAKRVRRLVPWVY